jgi:AraC-like DNA-binding protein
MKPILETIQPTPGTSFFLSHGLYGATEPFWHLHPEYEIVYIKNGSSEQHVGSHYTRYTDGTLLMIGPNIPHANMGNYDYDNNIAVVIQMSKTFLEERISAFSELNYIKNLLQRAQHGIQFSTKFKKNIETRIESIASLPPDERLLELISVISLMARTHEYELLNANAINYEQHSNSYNRVKQITAFVARNYHRTIQLSEIASICGLTETSFSRFFKKITGKPFITFLNEYRIQKACSLLTDKHSNIAEIMYQCGFKEAAHFTRVFKKTTGYSPREYRNNLLKSPKLNIELSE